jgi:putative endonuclease
MSGQFYVYMLANESRMLYTGMTNSLERRGSEHKLKLMKGYARRYNLTRLVYYEVFTNAKAAIAREKQLKGWRRARKVALIERANPRWRDLAEGW